MEEENREPVNVLIVGAGPVGLCAAIELTRRNYRVSIIEKRSAVPRQTGAVVIKSRSLALLEASGLSEEIIQHGVVLNGLEIAVEPHTKVFFGDQELNREGRYPSSVSISQSTLEKICKNHLAQKYSLSVRDEVEFLSYEERAQGVVSKVLLRGRIVEIFSDYLLGCDGGGSAVRREMGARLHGRLGRAHWSVVDAEVEWQETPSPLTSLSNGVVRIVAPIAEGRYSITANIPNVLSTLPASARLGSIHWLAEFRAPSKVSNCLQKGRAFLAGDAAHVLVPTAGSGLNLGIEDACLFAQLMQQHQLPQYEQWRRPIVSAAVEDAQMATALLAVRSPLLRKYLLVETFCRSLQWPWVRREFIAHFNREKSSWPGRALMYLLKLGLSCKIRRL